MENSKLDEICDNIYKKYNEKFVKEAFSLLCLLLNNIINNPKEDKFRNFKLTNINIRNKILIIKESIDLIKVIGYTQESDEYMKYNGDPRTLKEATYIINKYLHKIEETLKEQERKEKEAHERMIQKNLEEINRKMRQKKEEEEKIRQQLENDKREREKMDKPTDSVGRNLQYGCTEIKIQPSRGG